MPETRLAPAPALLHPALRVAAAFGSVSATLPAASADAGLWQAFAAQVARAPDAIAVCDTDQPLTYRALAMRANAVSAGLAAHGVSALDRVAMQLPRGPDALTAMLGILHRGASFVPIDPALPPSQRDALLTDCAPRCMIVQDAAPAMAAGLATLCIATLRAYPPVTDSTLLASAHPADPDAVAAIMYTSGSTGQPKGVCVPHRGVLRLVLDADYVALGPDQTILHAAPLAFDASTFEIWATLLHGGQLAILPTDRPSADDIARLIATHRVTTAWLTAGLFHLLAGHRMDAFAPLRQLLAGGDVLSPTHVRAVLRAHPSLRLINGYGPTENTTFTCCHTVMPDDLDGGPIPIGRPIRGTTVHVLDDGLRPVPLGQPGQLCTGGQGVARGYLGQPDLTAERFRPDPFTDEPGALLYLTGDRVCARADGALLFLGREDRQIKLDGHRVELDGIEHAMRQLPGVRDAACVLDAAPQDGKRLLGFVAGGPPNPLQALRTSLPAWSLPSRIIVLDALPLTANGKTDRARLLALATSDTQPAADASTPAHPAASGQLAAIEEQLTALLASLLCRSTIDRDANFLDLGATSLQLMTLHATLVRTLAPDLALLTLFQTASIRSLAAHLATPAAVTGTPDAMVARAKNAAMAMQRARSARVA